MIRPPSAAAISDLAGGQEDREAQRPDDDAADFTGRAAGARISLN
jgi:hypothetical protein